MARGARQPAAPGAHRRPRRVLLKLSGEMIGGSSGAGFAAEGLSLLADQIAGARGAGAEIAVMIGGGNLVRGTRAGFLPRAEADGIGMLGTLMNALALRAALESRETPAAVLSAFAVPRFADLYRPELGRALLAEGRVLLLAGGTGQTHLTTDTAAALRALELHCTLLIKATKVDGVYSADPAREPGARRFASLSYEEVLARRLAVMDLTAITLCMENGLPLVVLNATTPGSVARYLRSGRGGTRVGAVARRAPRRRA